MNQSNIQAFSSLLLNWYQKAARDLPWRHSRDPYEIWISEIMLQQTRVAAVLGYYDRFLRRFPTVKDLAQAPEEDLMKCWEGLGYYSRARNLKKAAQVIVEMPEFPLDYQTLLTLPGIGDYTASAISSAFGERQAAVDGNVLRVITRLYNIHEDVLKDTTKKEIRKMVQERMPEDPEEIRLFSQAMMELGATVCVPNGEPSCDLCPFQADCEAKKQGTIRQLPHKEPKKARRKEEKTILVLFQGEKVALQKRPEKGLLAGLWEFPSMEGKVSEMEIQKFLQEKDLRILSWRERRNSIHIFSHVEWHMTGYAIDVRGDESGYHWVSREELEQIAIPSAFLRYTEQVRELLPQEEIHDL